MDFLFLFFYLSFCKKILLLVDTLKSCSHWNYAVCSNCDQRQAQLVEWPVVPVHWWPPFAQFRRRFRRWSRRTWRSWSVVWWWWFLLFVLFLLIRRLLKPIRAQLPYHHHSHVTRSSFEYRRPCRCFFSNRRKPLIILYLLNNFTF